MTAKLLVLLPADLLDMAIRELSRCSLNPPRDLLPLQQGLRLALSRAGGSPEGSHACHASLYPCLIQAASLSSPRHRPSVSHGLPDNRPVFGAWSKHW
jgi:hypothetical protein